MLKTSRVHSIQIRLTLQCTVQVLQYGFPRKLYSPVQISGKPSGEKLRPIGQFVMEMHVLNYNDKMSLLFPPFSEYILASEHKPSIQYPSIGALWHLLAFLACISYRCEFEVDFEDYR